MKRSFVTVTIEEARLMANARLRRHSHETAHACLVLDGAFCERAGRGIRWCKPGAARIAPPGDVRDITVSHTGARGLLVTCETQFAMYEELRPPAEPRVLPAGSVGSLASQLYRRLLDRDTSPFDVELLVLELFAPAARTIRGSLQWLDSLREWLRETGVVPTAASLASYTGLHPVYVARAFRRRFGCSIGAYVRRRRASRAHRLLTATTLPLAIVAADAGYADQAHLTRDLRRRLGTTPAALRVRDVQDDPG